MNTAPWHWRHRTAVDVTVAVFFVLLDTALTLVGASWWPAAPGPLAWSMLCLQALACGSLFAWRRVPLLPTGVLAAFTLLLTLLISPAGALTPEHGLNIWAPSATIVAAYGPVWGSRNRRQAVALVAVLTLVVARPWELSASVVTIGVLRTALGPILALYFRARRALVQALTERAERAERERHLLAEQARAEERTRLAGEMHDVVTHRVSLMVLQAGSLRMTTSDEQTRAAAEEMRATGSQALEELRDLVGILRTAPEEDTAPAATDLAELAAESTAAGAPADLHCDGDPSLASPVVARTTYRIVREALTNVRKHAPGASVTVRVSYDAAGVRVVVRNSAPTGVPDAALAGSGSGLGIATLRQRVELVRGTLRAAPCSDGGFCIEAALPAYVPTAESAV